MNNKTSPDNGKGNSSNPRPGQNPFPNATGSTRQTYTNPQERPSYSSSYSNNFDRESARFSTGRAAAGSQYRTESTAYPQPLRLPAPRPPPEPKRDYEESIYGMYGDVKTPKEPLPRQKSQRQRRPPPPLEDEDSADEEVPRRPDPEPNRPRFERQQSRLGPGPQHYNSRREQRSSPRDERRSDRRDEEQNERRSDQSNTRQREEESGNRNFRHVNINIDTGGGGGTSRTYEESGSFGQTNINIGTPFGDGGFPFRGRNNGGGGRLPVNMPFNLPINLPFGL